MVCTRIRRGTWFARSAVVAVAVAVTGVVQAKDVIGKVPFLKRPQTISALIGLPLELIEDAQAEAWARTYNNFLYNDEECFDRAVDVIAGLADLMTRRGISYSLRLRDDWALESSNVAKLLIVFPAIQESHSDGTQGWRYRWRYHIIAVLRDQHGQWHPVDPDRRGVSPATPEAWVETTAHDIYGNRAKVTGLAVGKLYTAIPKDGEVYVYWLPADFYGLTYDSDYAHITGNTTMDPLSGWATAIGHLEEYRKALLQQDPSLKISGADLPASGN